MAEHRRFRGKIRGRSQAFFPGPLLSVFRLSYLTVYKVSDRPESLCAGLWVPCRISWAWCGPALSQNPNRNRRFPAGSLKVFGALLAQPSGGCPGCSTAVFGPVAYRWWPLQDCWDETFTYERLPISGIAKGCIRFMWGEAPWGLPPPTDPPGSGGCRPP